MPFTREKGNGVKEGMAKWKRAVTSDDEPKNFHSTDLTGYFVRYIGSGLDIISACFLVYWRHLFQLDIPTNVGVERWDATVTQ